MKSDIPAELLASGVLIGNLIIAGLALGTALMLAAAVWIATTS